MVHKQLLPLIASIAFACASHAQAPQGTDTALQTQVASIFARFDQPDSAGCAVGVIQNGQLILARGFGMANLEHGIPNGPSLVYDIGSTSKQFTAASILLLAQRGDLSLDDDVRKHVPELPQYQRPITIRHLLNHTSGLRDYLGLFSMAGISFENTTTEQDALDFILRQKALNFAPGDDFLYSNSGYLLLSIIVRRTSDKPLTEFAKENIFDPLGMTHTFILDQHRKIVPRRATAYSRNAAGEFQIQMSHFEQTGDGAVQSSIEDLVKWDRNFYDPKIGGREWLEQMHVVGKLNNGAALDYAAGLYVDRYKGLRRVSHQGAWAGYRANLVRFPDQNLSVACLCNAGGLDVTGLALQVAGLYLEKELAAFDAKAAASRRAATMKPPRNMHSKIGLYRNTSTGELRRISIVDDKLRIDSMASQSREIAPGGSNRFTIVGEETTSVEFTAESGLRIARQNRGASQFERAEQFAPSASELSDFTGRYSSEELNVTYDFSVEDGQLVVTYPDGVKRPLVATFRNAFAVISGLQFEFDRDDSGRITGFGAGAGRIRNLRFSKIDSQ